MKTFILQATTLCLTMTWTTVTVAAEPADIPPPPPPGAVVEPDEGTPPSLDEIKPDVTIKRQKDQIVEEYRVNGRLYMVRVIPRKGKPYYLLYPDSGTGDPTRGELETIQTPYWKLFEW